MRINLGRELTRLGNDDRRFDETAVREAARRALRSHRVGFAAVIGVVVLALIALSWLAMRPPPVSVASAAPESRLPGTFPFVSVRSAEVSRRCGFAPRVTATDSVPGGSVIVDDATRRTCFVGYHDPPVAQPVSVRDSDARLSCQQHTGYDFSGWSVAAERTLGSTRQVVLMPPSTNWFAGCRLVAGDEHGALTFTNLEYQRRGGGIVGLNPFVQFHPDEATGGGIAELTGVATVWDAQRNLSETAALVRVTEVESGDHLDLAVTGGFVPLVGVLHSPRPVPEAQAVYRDIRIEVFDADNRLLFQVGP